MASPFAGGPMNTSTERSRPFLSRRTKRASSSGVALVSTTVSARRSCRSEPFSDCAKFASESPTTRHSQPFIPGKLCSVFRRCATRCVEPARIRSCSHVSSPGAPTRDAGTERGMHEQARHPGRAATPDPIRSDRISRWRHAFSSGAPNSCSSPCRAFWSERGALPAHGTPVHDASIGS